MSKFNLKNYQKSNGDLHTDKALSVDHAKAPNAVTDKQLRKDQHSDAPAHLTEKQLDKMRVEDPGLSIENRLNKAKGHFGIKHRNEDSYKGNINKLEEKRVAGDKNEDEKYEVASQTNKKMKWWETKTNDGLKLASATFRKLAAEEKRKIGYDESIVPEHERPDLGSSFEEQESGLINDTQSNDYEFEPTTTVDPKNPMGGGDDDFAITQGIKNKDVWVSLKKDPLPHPPFSDRVNADQYAAFYQIGFDPMGWTDEGDEAKLRQAVVDKFLELRPDLQGIITPNSPEVERAVKNKNDGNGYYNIRLLGDEFINDSPELSESVDIEQLDLEFKLEEYGETDVGGTDMAVGKVIIPEDLPMEDQELLEALRDYISERHPGLKVTPDAIQISADGTSATFAVPVPKESIIEPRYKAPPEAAPDGGEFEIVDDIGATPENTDGGDDEWEIIDDIGTTPQTKASNKDRVVVSQSNPVDKKKLKR